MHLTRRTYSTDEDLLIQLDSLQECGKTEPQPSKSLARFPNTLQ